MTDRGLHLRSLAALVALAALVLGAAYAWGGWWAAAYGLGMAGSVHLAGYWSSHRLMLALARARPLSPGETPWLQQMLATLAARAGLPAPRLYLIDHHEANALSVGRDPAHSAVAVTRGLLGLLTPGELSAVLAHELAHIRHRDTALATAATVLASGAGILASLAAWSYVFFPGSGGFAAVLAMTALPVAAGLLRAALCRQRELLADRGAARLTGRPDDLAAALLRLEAAALARRLVSYGLFGPPGEAAPVPNSPWARLAATHPPTSLRVRLLAEGRPRPRPRPPRVVVVQRLGWPALRLPAGRRGPGVKL